MRALNEPSTEIKGCRDMTETIKGGFSIIRARANERTSDGYLLCISHFSARQSFCVNDMFHAIGTAVAGAYDVLF